jgi:hypothetical protein
MSEDIETFIQTLLETKKQIAKLTEYKNQIEDYIGQVVFTQPKLEGTDTTQVGPYKLKMTYALQRKVEMSAYEALRNNPTWQTIPHNVIKWKAELEVKLYKQLQGDQKLFMNNMVIEKPVKPTLTIEVLQNGDN